MTDFSNIIRFICGHCGQRVQVPVGCAGKKGRCPYCGAVLEIPHKDQPDVRVPARKEPTAKVDRVLVTAGRTSQDKPTKTVPPPPPTRSAVPASEDLTIEELEQSSDETAEMPALQNGESGTKAGKNVGAGDKTPNLFRSFARARTRRHLVLLALTIIAAISAGCAIFISLTR